MNQNSGNYVKESIIAIIVSLVCIGINELFAFLLDADSREPYFSLYFIGFLTIAIQYIVFLHASGIFGNTRTEKYFDLTGSLTYLITLAFSFFSIFSESKPSARQIIISVLPAIWCSRLGWFLFTRIANNRGEDRRFKKLKTNIFKFLQIWSIQGVWVFVTLLSVLISNQINDGYNLNVVNYIGIAVWIFGFTFEVVSDAQKRSFKENPSNKDKWISGGLWSISRHPNYFGEIVLWFGITMITINQYYWKDILIRFISPIFVAFLLIFVSGIPLLEEYADKKFGHIEEYKKYKKETPVLVPYIGRRGSAMF